MVEWEERAKLGLQLRRQSGERRRAGAQHEEGQRRGPLGDIGEMWGRYRGDIGEM